MNLPNFNQTSKIAGFTLCALVLSACAHNKAQIDNLIPAIDIIAYLTNDLQSSILNIEGGIKNTGNEPLTDIDIRLAHSDECNASIDELGPREAKGFRCFFTQDGRRVLVWHVDAIGEITGKHAYDDAFIITNK